MSNAENTRPIPGFMMIVLLACFMLFVVACGGGGGGGGSGGGDNYGGGGGGDGGGGDGGGGTALEPTLASIQENIFTPICTQCHTGGSAPQGLRLDAGVAYGMLVNVASSEVPELDRVEPGDPDNSYIIQKLEGTAAVGERMPLGGPYLSADEINTIRQWISDGAVETAAAATPSSKTTLTAGWPVPDSTLSKGPATITLIADGELDTTLLHAASVQVSRVDANGMRHTIDKVDIRVGSLAPTVINLGVEKDAWLPGEYEVRLLGSGASPIADRAGRLIDGDGDGEPGGDFLLHFTVRSE